MNTCQTHPQREAAFGRLHKGGAAFGRPPFVEPFVDGSGRCSSIKQQAASKHQASSSKHQASSIKHQNQASKSSICFVTNQHTTEVEALLTRQISIIFRRASFPNFEISRFSDLQVLNFENVEFARFGIINPVPNRLVSIRTAFQSRPNHSEIVRVWIASKKLRSLRVSAKF